MWGGIINQEGIGHLVQAWFLPYSGVFDSISYLFGGDRRKLDWVWVDVGFQVGEVRYRGLRVRCLK